MESHSFEDSAGGNPHQDSKDKTLSPSESKIKAGFSGTTTDQPKDVKMTDKRTFKDEEDRESPPAYVQRHIPQDPKRDNLEELEPPAPEPVQQLRDVRLDPEFQQQARNRRERRSRQNLVEGPCSLRPNIPNPPPLPEQEAHPDLNQQPTREPTPSEASLTCRERLQAAYQRMCVFSFQFPFHTLLLTWPLATAAMGVVNLNVCHMNLFMPYVMLVVGLLGTASIVLRLYTLYFEKRLTNRNTSGYWIGVRVAELIVWVFFVAQLIYFFKQTPSSDPRDKHYCKWRYYKINCGLMLLSSITMLGWIVVHAAKIIQWLRRRITAART